MSLAVMHGHRVNPAIAGALDPRVKLHALRLPGERWRWRFDTVLRKARIDWSAIRAAQRRWLSGIIAAEEPEVIHSHLLKADRLAAEQAQAAGGRLRHIVTLHGDYSPYLDGHADPFMLDARGWIGRIVRSASAMVGVTRDHVEHLERDFPEAANRVALIYNGYDTPPPPPGRPALGLPEGVSLFGMVSRGVEQKGWGAAVEAFRSLGRDDWRLVLVGEGPAIDRLRAENPPGVLFVGFSPRPTDWIAHFDVCLLPSLFPHESLPTAVVEYLACAKPVIATALGEIPAMLHTTEGEAAGVPVDFDGANISTAELAAAMTKLADDPVLREAMGTAAEACFQRFAMERCVESYRALYRGEPLPLPDASTSRSRIRNAEA